MEIFFDKKKVHNSAIKCMELNKYGTMMATASKKGTIIRITYF